VFRLRVGTSFGGRAFGGESRYIMAGFSGRGGQMQKSCRIRTNLSSPLTMVIISQICGEVDVRYVRCVSELNKGRANVVSRASTKKNRKKLYEIREYLRE
jgi:hypothetical protein